MWHRENVGQMGQSSYNCATKGFSTRLTIILEENKIEDDSLVKNFILFLASFYTVLLLFDHDQSILFISQIIYLYYVFIMWIMIALLDWSYLKLFV